MSTWWKTAGWMLAGALGGCLGATDDERCGGAVVADGSACVMVGPISETGFDCPPAMPYEYGGEFGDASYLLCSSDPDLDPNEIDDAFREGGEPEWPGHQDRGDDHDGGPNDSGPDDGGPNDGGPNDGGPNDSGPDDSGPDDGGPNDGGSACGNGVIDPGEQCDDANLVDGDGCTSGCRIEACIDSNGNGIPCEPCTGSECDPADPGDPSDPSDPSDPCDPATGRGCDTCGNAVIDPGEVCDDGNQVDGDGCSAACASVEICGNALLDVANGEVCDDGNNVSGDGCSADCRSNEACGNAVLDAGEQCDDGNVLNGDGCDARCGLEPACDGACDP